MESSQHCAGWQLRRRTPSADPIGAITCVMSLSSDLIPSSAGTDSLGGGLEAGDDELGSQGEETITTVEPDCLPQIPRQGGSKVRLHFPWERRV